MFTCKVNLSAGDSESFTNGIGFKTRPVTRGLKSFGSVSLCSTLVIMTEPPFRIRRTRPTSDKRKELEQLIWSEKNASPQNALKCISLSVTNVTRSGLKRRIVSA